MTDPELAEALAVPATRVRAAKAIALRIFERSSGGRTVCADAETAWECVGQQTRELAFAHVDAIIAELRALDYSAPPLPLRQRRR